MRRAIDTSTSFLTLHTWFLCHATLRRTFSERPSQGGGDATHRRPHGGDRRRPQLPQQQPTGNRQQKPTSQRRIHESRHRELGPISSSRSTSQQLSKGSAALPSTLPSAQYASALLQSCSDFAKTGTAYQLLRRSLQNKKTWMDALEIMERGCSVVAPIVKPRTDEVMDLLTGVPVIASSLWSMSLVYGHVIKKACHVDPPPQRAVAHMIDLHRMKGALRKARIISKVDLEGVWSGRVELTNDASRAVLALFAAEGSWVEAIALVQQRRNLQTSPAALAAVLSVVAQRHSISKGIEVYQAIRSLRRENLADPAVVPHDRALWAHPGIVPLMTTALLRAIKNLPGETNFQLAQGLLAENLSSGTPLQLSAFIPVAEMMNRRGMWAEVLSTMAHKFGVFQAGLHLQSRTVLAVLRSALLQVNPYYDVSSAELLRLLALRCDPAQKNTGIMNPKLSLVFSRSFHFQFASYTVPLSVALSKIVCPEIRMVHRELVHVVTAALEKGDTMIVLDTNVIIHLAQRNMSVRSLIPAIRRLHPHLLDKPLETFVVPFTVANELSSLVISRSRASFRERRVLWTRVIRILKETNVLSFATEFPSVSNTMI
jgi:hypothetical protein